MGARLAQQRLVADRTGGDRAERLHLLTPHHVGPSAPPHRDAGNETDASGWRDSRRRQRVEIGGRIDIGGHDPAAVRSHHARGKHPVDTETPSKPIDLGWVILRGQGEDARAIGHFVVNGAVGTDQIGTPVGRSPVHGDIGAIGHPVPLSLYM